MNTKTKNVLSVMIIAIMLVVTVTATYAFFAAQVTGTDASTSVYFATANQGITITFEGGNAETLTNIYPRETAWLEKDITIRSTAISSDITSIYTFNMVVEENGYHPEDIKYTFMPKTLTGVEEGTSTGTNDLTNLDNRIDIGHGLVKGTSAAEITYTLKVYFVNDPTRNQNTGSSASARFYITYDWTKYQVNLIFNLDGGNLTEDYSGEYSPGAVIRLPEPTKKGYVFTGWTVEGEGASVVDGLLTIGIGNVLVKAQWENAIPEAKSFATDDWATIAYYAQHPVDDKTPYEVGETKEISLSGFTNGEENSGGKYTIRIANNSNYDCTLESKTACGFVIEFQDIITDHRMNASNTNVGGWPSSELYSYVKTNIYNALPSDLRTVIIDTAVISGHGSSDRNSSRSDGNWTSTDKLYLLSTREVWGNCTGGTNDKAGCYDYGSSDTITRQLDYYANLGVVSTDTVKRLSARKPLNDFNTQWWLRSARSSDDKYFGYVDSDGARMTSGAGDANGVAPAFRIG